MHCAMIDGKRYLFANGYKTKRRYFKTVLEKTKTFSQPTLSSNGAMEVTQEAYEVEVQEGEAYDRVETITYLEQLGAYIK